MEEAGCAASREEQWAELVEVVSAASSWSRIHQRRNDGCAKKISVPPRALHAYLVVSPGTDRPGYP